MLATRSTRVGPAAAAGDATRAELGKDRKVVTWNPFDSGAAALDDPSAVDRALEIFAGDPAFSVIVSCATVGIRRRRVWVSTCARPTRSWLPSANWGSSR